MLKKASSMMTRLFEQCGRCKENKDKKKTYLKSEEQLKFLGHAVKKEGLDNLTLIEDTHVGRRK